MYSSQLLLQSMSCIFSAFFFSIYCVLMRPLSLIIFLVIVCSGTECVFFFFGSVPPDRINMRCSFLI